MHFFLQIWATSGLAFLSGNLKEMSEKLVASLAQDQYPVNAGKNSGAPHSL